MALFWFILFPVGVIVCLAILIKSAQRPKELNKRFDNIIEWKIGDEIEYEYERYRDSHYTRKRHLAVFDKKGIWVVSRQMLDEFLKYKDNGDAHKFAEYLEYIPSQNINENITLKKRKKRMEMKEKLYNSHSYHNTLVSMQEEFNKIMEEDRNNNKNKIQL